MAKLSFTRQKPSKATLKNLSEIELEYEEGDSAFSYKVEKIHHKNMRKFRHAS